MAMATKSEQETCLLSLIHTVLRTRWPLFYFININRLCPFSTQKNLPSETSQVKFGTSLETTLKCLPPWPFILACGWRHPLNREPVSANWDIFWPSFWPWGSPWCPFWKPLNRFGASLMSCINPSKDRSTSGLLFEAHGCSKALGCRDLSGWAA